MDSKPTRPGFADILSAEDELNAGMTGESGMSISARRCLDAGAVLRAQAPSRMVGGVVLTVLQLLVILVANGRAEASAIAVPTAGVAAAYIIALGLAHAGLRRGVSASSSMVTTVLAIDLAFVFVMTAVTTEPAHYDRALLGMICIMHVANYFFGSRHAWRVVQLGVAGYLALIAYASLNGMAIDIMDELWTLVLGAAGVTLIVGQADDGRRRLRTIVGLFEHAEQGDFSRSYDVGADRRPDAITRVGQAYNRVRAQLSSLVLTDPLTGCLNRRGFDQSMSREVARAARADHEFALVAIDLDHFKSVNDTYGHLAGDVVLREVGKLLLGSGRACDIVARVGGEEFAVLLAETGHTGAHLFATRLCEQLAAHPFMIGNRAAPVTLTTSIGVAVGSPRGIDDFAELLWSRADDALYDAKRAGRACVRVWTESTRHSGEHVAIGSHTEHTFRGLV